MSLSFIKAVNYIIPIFYYIPKFVFQCDLWFPLHPQRQMVGGRKLLILNIPKDKSGVWCHFSLPSTLCLPELTWPIVWRVFARPNIVFPLCPWPCLFWGSFLRCFHVVGLKMKKDQEEPLPSALGCNFAHVRAVVASEIELVQPKGRKLILAFR